MHQWVEAMKTSEDTVSSIAMLGLWPTVLEATGQFFLRRSRQMARTPLSLNLRSQRKDSRPVGPQLLVPTDLLVSAWRDLFPAERMMFLGGSADGSTRRISSVWDVTGSDRSIAHVKASPALLGRALLDCQVAGAHVVGWLHSHPGHGIAATYPSHIDWRQDADLRRDFGSGIVGFIATADGYVRAWGSTIDECLIQVCMLGNGLMPVEGETHVYRLAVR